MYLQKDLQTINFSISGATDIESDFGQKIVQGIFKDLNTLIDQRISVALTAEYTKQIKYIDGDIPKDYRCLYIRTYSIDEKSSEIIKKIVGIQTGKKLVVYTYYSTYLSIKL